jgi:hypothetical protein
MATIIGSTGITFPDASTQTTAAATVTVASAAEAIAGTNNTNMITPLRMREGFNAAGTAPVFACRAWVNFNGTGTVDIRASGNVSSITDNGAGDYTINFTTAMQDAKYSVVALAKFMASGGDTCHIKTASSLATSSFRMQVYNTLSGNQDSDIICVSAFR